MIRHTRDVGKSGFIAFFGLVLALGLTVPMPRFLAVNATACAVFGGEWLKENVSGWLACVFYGG